MPEEAEFERLLAWFVRENRQVREAFGFRKLAVVQWDEPEPAEFGFEFRLDNAFEMYRDPGTECWLPYTYRTEDPAALRLMEELGRTMPPVPRAELITPSPVPQAALTIVAEERVRPNARCPCGSGLKYKRCCG
jgi:hypothetical protein